MNNHDISSDQIGKTLDELQKVKWGVDFSRYKAVFSGTTMEVYEFGKDVHFGGQLKPHKRRKRSRYLGIRKPFSISRARLKIRRLIACNSGQHEGFKDKFMTFTFAKNIKNLREANALWSKFIPRLKKYVGHPLKYVAVVEFQDKTRGGVIHYHAVFFNLPYILNDKIAEIWSHGFIKINNVRKIHSIGAYVSKYLQKGVVDARLFNEKCYFTSRGLIKPIVVRIPPLDIDLLAPNPVEYKLEETRQLPFCKWTGLTTYKRYAKIE